MKELPSYMFECVHCKDQMFDYIEDFLEYVYDGYTRPVNWDDLNEGIFAHDETFDEVFSNHNCTKVKCPFCGYENTYHSFYNKRELIVNLK
jgi:hypothetical protein